MLVGKCFWKWISSLDEVKGQVKGSAVDPVQRTVGVVWSAGGHVADMFTSLTSSSSCDLNWSFLGNTNIQLESGESSKWLSLPSQHYLSCDLAVTPICGSPEVRGRDRVEHGLLSCLIHRWSQSLWHQSWNWRVTFYWQWLMFSA